MTEIHNNRHPEPVLNLYEATTRRILAHLGHRYMSVIITFGIGFLLGAFTMIFK
jgi:hypothetical protein